LGAEAGGVGRDQHLRLQAQLDLGHVPTGLPAGGGEQTAAAA
jgi:hypothetical protein